MTNKKPPRIGIISMVRDDNFYVPRWISYYGNNVGHNNLFLILDGHDQPLPSEHESINVLRLPRLDLSRARGDANRAGIISSLAQALFRRYDIIIAHDIDEFLVVDPEAGMSLSEYLQQPRSVSSISALGLDVGQHLEKEAAIDPDKPFLEQRRYAHVSARYTKSIVAYKPVKWGSGFHRVKGRNFHIDNNLFLFHFGMVDYEKSNVKIEDEALLKSGWKGHFGRRHELFDLILKNPAVDGDSFFRKARQRQRLFRPVYAWNKPGMLKEKPIIIIPERFRKTV